MSSRVTDKSSPISPLIPPSLPPSVCPRARPSFLLARWRRRGQRVGVARGPRATHQRFTRRGGTARRPNDDVSSTLSSTDEITPPPPPPGDTTGINTYFRPGRDRDRATTARLVPPDATLAVRWPFRLPGVLSNLRVFLVELSPVDAVAERAGRTALPSSIPSVSGLRDPRSTVAGWAFGWADRRSRRQQEDLTEAWI